MLNENIIKAIQSAKNYPVITRVGIFGSYARGEQTAESDIDILYDYESIDENKVLDILNFYGDIEKELNKYNLNFDYVSYKGVINSENIKIKNRILNDVIWVYTRQ